MDSGRFVWGLHEDLHPYSGAFWHNIGVAYNVNHKYIFSIFTQILLSFFYAKYSRGVWLFTSYFPPINILLYFTIHTDITYTHMYLLLCIQSYCSSLSLPSWSILFFLNPQHIYFTKMYVCIQHKYILSSL